MMPISKIKDVKLKMWQLQQRQNLPLSLKIKLSEMRIKEFYEYYGGEVYVAFSGGKDSTVLLHIVRKLYPEVPAVFVDTGLEYPEIRNFVKITENTVWLKPEMPFREVLNVYGYPVISKETALKIREVRMGKKDSKTTKLRMTGIRSDGQPAPRGKIPEKWMYLLDAPFKISDRCCDIMKKKPFHQYEKTTGKRAYVGMMASDSSRRLMRYLRNGCNIFDGRAIQSNPLGFWKEKDIWDYIKEFRVPYSKIYDMGYKRTGCVFCMFGAHLTKPNRFQLMAETHPKLYRYCLDVLKLDVVLEYIGVDYSPLLGSYKEAK